MSHRHRFSQAIGMYVSYRPIRAADGTALRAPRLRRAQVRLDQVGLDIWESEGGRCQRLIT